MSNPPTSPLPNDIFRYIQQEETIGLGPFSEFLLQGIGGDMNYLKKHMDDLQNTINQYFSSGAISVTGIFMASYINPSVGSPNGKQWYAALVTPEFNGNITSEWRMVIQGATTRWVSSASYSGISGSISGSVLTVGPWGHEVSGFGLYQT